MFSGPRFFCFIENFHLFFSKIDIFVINWSIGLRVVQFCLLSVLMILKTNWMSVPRLLFKITRNDNWPNWTPLGPFTIAKQCNYS